MIAPPLHRPPTEAVTGLLQKTVASFHQWRLSEAEHECDGGFPLLRGFQDTDAIALIEFAESLELAQQRALLTGLVGSRPIALGENGSAALSQAEKRLVDTFQPVRRGGGPNTQAEVMRRMETGFIKRKDLKRVVINRMNELLGPGESKPGGMYRWTTTLRTLLVITDVDLGTTHAQMRYHQNLYLGSRALENRVLHRVSVPQLLGLGLLDWSLVCPGEADATAERLVRYCKHFLDAVPRLFEVDGR